MPRIGFFPGSTIGNFEPHEAAAFLRHAGAHAGRGRDPDHRRRSGQGCARVLHAAYNDAAGVTAQFNLNLLARINRELGGDFDLDALRAPCVLQSRAPAASRCISPAASARRCASPAASIEFRAGETIHTENSYKYTVETSSARSRAAPAGRRRLAAWSGRAMAYLLGARRSTCRAAEYGRGCRTLCIDARCPSAKPIPGACSISSASPVRADVDIPTEDADAWPWYPRHRWVYDKIAIALSQGLDAGPHGVPPPAFPVFSKPIINLKGMGVGSRVLRSAPPTTSTHYAPGHMWMTLLKGRHVSSDVAVVDGEPRWWRHVTGAPGADGTFDHWTVHAAAGSRDRGALRRLDPRRISRATPASLNLETIGGRIIEVHLRLSDQWPDLYGAGWVEALVRLYQRGRWDFADADRRDGYSVVLFGPHGTRYRHPPRGAGREGRAPAGRLQRADHLPRGPRAGAPRHAARRLPARHRQCLDRSPPAVAGRELLRAHFIGG